LIKCNFENLLSKADRLGASYVDPRYQRYDYELVEVENKMPTNHSSRRLSGVGIRVRMKGATGFAFTSDLSNNNRYYSPTIKLAHVTIGGK